MIGSTHVRADDLPAPVEHAMSATRRLALIGFGASGSRVAEMIRAGAAGDVKITGVLVRHPDAHARSEAAAGLSFTDSLDALLEARPDAVVELAGHEALRAYGPTILRRGFTLLTINAGVFSDDEAWRELLEAAQDGHARLVLPSGAIAGLDAIESAALAGLERVRHVVRKPPRSLIEDAARADEVIRSGEPAILYEGPAREATRRYPQNVNVVAMVSLAGIGFDRTTVAVVADPGVEHNTHEVTAEGPFGSIQVVMRNVPSPENPKTGLIVPAAVVRAIRRLDTPFDVGG
jgi:aspartate dehydrogenase